jgi:hypothetical protein
MVHVGYIRGRMPGRLCDTVPRHGPRAAIDTVQYRGVLALTLLIESRTVTYKRAQDFNKQRSLRRLFWCSGHSESDLHLVAEAMPRFEAVRIL